jgi:hypothetical protein
MSGRPRRCTVTKNMGAIDRIVRLVVVAVIVFLLVQGTISGTTAVILGVVAAVFLLTSALGFCPLYVPLKLSTRGKS